MAANPNDPRTSVLALVPPSASGRVPPHDIDAEGAILSAAMIDRAALERVSSLLKPEHFYSEPHRWIFEACAALCASSMSVNVVSVAGWLRDRDRTEQVGGMPYLTQVVNSAPALSKRDVDGYARAIVEKARVRGLLAACQRISAEAYLDYGAAPAFLERSALALSVASSPIATGLSEGPTAAEPMRGLTHLGPIAVVGRQAVEALAKAPVLYVWEDIALLGIIVLIAGGVGCGKTTLLFLILIARANKGEAVKLLGREVDPAPPGTYVVIIEGEHGESSAARKLVKSCRLLGVNEGALDRVILIARKAVRIGSPEWQDVERLVAAGLVSDIALDTIARVAPGDANSESEQVAIFDMVARAVDRAPSEMTKPVVWVAGHTKKDGGDDLESVSGSAQRTGQADTVLLVRAERRDGRVTSSKVVFAKLREEPDDYPGPVEFTVTRDAVVMADAIEPDDARPLEERIIERLRLGKRTKNKLSEELGRNKADLEDPISNLFAAHQIVSANVTIRGQTYKAFDLRNDAGLDAGRASTPDVAGPRRTNSR